MITIETIETFDTLDGALNRIDTLKDAKQVAYLGHEIIEVINDKYGRIESALCVWLVRRGKASPVQASVPAPMPLESPVMPRSASSTIPVESLSVPSTRTGGNC